MKNYSYTLVIILIGVFLSCNSDESNNLSSAESRKSNAINDLKDELVDATNGWKIEYRPNADNGTYFLLLDFHKDGTVIIHSDALANSNENFFEQTIHYRIDATLGLELIFETYGVFHYLFEQQQATFGGEFVFTFLEKESDNLLFESKSDVVNKTILEFIPAQPEDTNLLSTELVQNLNQFAGLTPQIFGGLAPIQHLALNDKGISIFWEIDLLKRTISVDMVGEGITINEILTNDNYILINHITGYSIQNDVVILDESFSFTVNGETNTISQISFSDFNTETASFCVSENMESPLYNGNIPGLGSVLIKKSLFSSVGFDFVPMAESSYSVNSLFIFDGNRNSLFQNGSIGNKLPNAVAFVFNYGFNSDEEPEDGIGFIISDDLGQSKTYLRELTSAVREGNKLTLELADSYYFSEVPDAGDEQNLKDVTDEIFEGGQVYIYDLPQENGKVFWLFNPCNRYEVFLVQ